MSKNRDANCVNKACTSVHANIMSLMNRDSLVAIEKSLKRNHDDNNDNIEKQRKLVCLALYSSKMSNEFF